MKESAIGIDVAKEQLDVVLLRQQPKQKPQHRQFPNSLPGHQQLLAWLSEQAMDGMPVGLEATGIYAEAVAERLSEAHYPVSIVNPLRIKRYGESELLRIKTDKTDAALIARFVLTQAPALWRPPSADQRTLRELVRGLLDVEELARQHANRQLSGVVGAALAPTWQAMQQQFQQHIAHLGERIAAHIGACPRLQRLLELYVSVIGIGEKTGWVCLAELDDLSRFATSRQMVAYLGLAPHLHQSGRSLDGPSPLSKAANHIVRKALYWPTISATQHNPLVQPLYERLVAQGRPKMVAIGAAMRKLVVITYAVVRSDQPFDPAYQRSDG